MGTAKNLVEKLKQNGQDFEWYPTTDEMIEVVKRHIPQDASSIMDIGAGDGRVLEKLKAKCEYANLYSVEVSQVLTQAQAKEIVPLGTDLHEQNLSALPVDFIFSNPPYREYEDWTCKIVSEGYAQRAFLVIPQRWKESNMIEKALKKRDASTRVIHSGDFYQAERQSRAAVDIVEVTYPTSGYGYRTKDNVKDPFDIWFDQNIDTFDQAPKEELSDYEAGEKLARMHRNSNIEEMVASYREEYERMESNYRAIFKLDYALLKELNVDKKHVREGLKKKMSGLKVKYWSLLFERLDAITSRLATKSSKKLLDKLTANNTVDFTAGNAYAVVLWAIKNANQYFDDQLVELFYELSTFDGVLKYKSNQKTWEKSGWRYNARNREFDHYALDYRIVVSAWKAIYQEGDCSQYQYPGNLHNNAHDLVSDIVAVMSNLGFSTCSLSSRNREWEGGKWQDWYDTNSDEILFQVKAHLNGNLHMRFMPAAIRAWNIQVGRILKWLNNEEDVVTELGYSSKDAERYFNLNNKISVSNVKLLPSPDKFKNLIAEARLYGRPANKSFEAFKEFVRAMSEKLGIPKERQSSDEEIRAAWKKFWEKADSDG